LDQRDNQRQEPYMQFAQPHGWDGNAVSQLPPGRHAGGSFTGTLTHVPPVRFPVIGSRLWPSWGFSIDCPPCGGPRHSSSSRDLWDSG
jgi:hypothetical protein